MAPEFVVLGIVSGSSVGMIVNDFDALSTPLSATSIVPSPLFFIFYFILLPFFLYLATAANGCPWRAHEMSIKS